MIEELILQGLSRKESEIYMSLIRYGSSRASSICKRVKINRTLVYALLEKLIDRGYVEKINMNNQAFYVPHDGEIFIQQARKQLEHAQSLAKNLNDIKLISNQPTIRTFQGLEGIRKMIEMFLWEAKQVGTEMLQIGQEIRFVQEYPELIEEFIGRRVSGNIALKLICGEFAHFEQYLNADRDRRELREVKFIPLDELDVESTTYICGDSVLALSLSDEIHGYILQNKHIADLNRKMFYLLWKKL